MAKKTIKLNLTGVTSDVVAKVVGILKSSHNRIRVQREIDAVAKLRHLTDLTIGDATKVVAYISSYISPKNNSSTK